MRFYLGIRVYLGVMPGAERGRSVASEADTFRYLSVWGSGFRV